MIVPTTNCGYAILEGVYRIAPSPYYDTKDPGPRILLEEVMAVAIHKGLISFSDNQAYGNGELFAKYIRDNNLGMLWETDEVENPVHPIKYGSRGIKVWTWAPDRAEITRQLEQLKKPVGAEKGVIPIQEPKIEG